MRPYGFPNITKFLILLLLYILLVVLILLYIKTCIIRLKRV